jgi:hypothetical protein
MSLKTTLFLIISIISVSAQALKPHIAKYQLSINGLKIAEEVRTLHQLDDEYFYTANAKTTGIAALIKKYSVSASSEFFIDQLGINGINYQIMELEDGQIKDNYSIDINAKHHRVSSNLTKTQPIIRNWKVKSGTIIDPLNLFLALAYDLQKTPNQVDFHYQVANGDSIEQQHYKKTGDQIINFNQQPMSTIKIEKISQGARLEAYFSPEYQYLPISIKQVKNGRDYHYQISDFQQSSL